MQEQSPNPEDLKTHLIHLRRQLEISMAINQVTRDLSQINADSLVQCATLLVDFQNQYGTLVSGCSPTAETTQSPTNGQQKMNATIPSKLKPSSTDKKELDQLRVDISQHLTRKRAKAVRGKGKSDRRYSLDVIVAKWRRDRPVATQDMTVQSIIDSLRFQTYLHTFYSKRGRWYFKRQQKTPSQLTQSSSSTGSL